MSIAQPPALSGWHLHRLPPDSAATPAELDAHSPRGHPVVGVSTVGALLPDSPWPDSAVDDFDWWLCTTAATTAAARLTFDGLTCPATLFVDGEPVDEVLSMFIPVTVDVPAGTHRVDLRFPSLNHWLSTRRGRGRWRSTLVAQQGLRWLRGTLLGRAPVYGGGSLPAPVGGWRPARLRTCGADAVTITADPASGRLSVRAQVWGVDQIRCVITDPIGATLLDTETNGADGAIAASIVVENPTLWWPNGYGDQPLYLVTLSADDEVLAERIAGFATVAVDRTDGAFALSVNGIDVFGRGVTWTPPDPVGLTVDADTLAAYLRPFASAGATTVRVVGGLVPEQPEFYRLCAELGLLVWQDAMLATFDPPEQLAPVIRTELDTLLTTLSGNPAIAVISGGSETIQQAEMLGLDGSRRELGLLTDQLAKTVAAHGTTPYIPNSPFSPDGALAIRPEKGVAHWFGVGGYLRPRTDVRGAGVRFAAESLAFAIPPSDDAIERDFGSLAVAGHSPAWKAAIPRDRLASWDFEDVRDHYVAEIFGVDPLLVRRTDPARYLQLGRLAVSEAMAGCYRFWRQRDSRCAGALILSSADLLPGAGWGLLGADGTPKLPLSVLRRRWASTAVSIVDAGLSGLRIDVHHDGPAPLDAILSLHLGSDDPVSQHISLPPRSSVTRYDSDLTGQFTDASAAFGFGPPRFDAAEVRLCDATGTILARDVVVLTAPSAPVPAGLSGSMREGDDGSSWELTVTTTASVRYVCLDVEHYAPADNCFDLVGGVPHRITLRATTQDTTLAPRVRISSVDVRDTVTVRAE